MAMKTIAELVELGKFKLKLYVALCDVLSDGRRRRLNYDELAVRIGCKSRQTVSYNIGRLLKEGKIGCEGRGANKVFFLRIG